MSFQTRILEDVFNDRNNHDLQPLHHGIRLNCRFPVPVQKVTQSLPQNLVQSVKKSTYIQLEYAYKIEVSSLCKNSSEQRDPAEHSGQEISFTYRWEKLSL